MGKRHETVSQTQREMNKMVRGGPSSSGAAQAGQAHSHPTSGKGNITGSASGKQKASSYATQRGKFTSRKRRCSANCEITTFVFRLSDPQGIILASPLMGRDGGTLSNFMPHVPQRSLLIVILQTPPHHHSITPSLDGTTYYLCGFYGPGKEGKGCA